MLTKAAVDGASAFLGRICLPAAEEIGLLFRDRVRAWRAANAVAIALKAERKLIGLGTHEGLHAHPRLVSAVVENGSWSETEEVQEMWAGLLASSCTADGKDEDNLLFIGILQQLTASEAKILNYACSTAKKSLTPSGLIWAEDLECPADRIREVTGVADIHRLDRELDHLRALGLIEGGFDYSTPITGATVAIMTPTSLALNMYARCQGSRQSPVEFFHVLPAGATPEGTA
jgi:hypothetical protein